MTTLRLFSYKMTYDSGFAPNPFGCTLTLATCKADIRKAKKVGDWIAGFTSKKLCGHKVGEEKLIYLMKVGEKITIDSYFHDSRFQDKIPGSKGLNSYFGDNIYRLVDRKDESLGYEQIPNAHHSLSEMENDVKGKYVLIADEYYYFGMSAIEIPSFVRPNIPKNEHPHGHLTKDLSVANEFIDYVKKSFSKHGTPHQAASHPVSCSLTCSSIVKKRKSGCTGC
ncbi:MAG: hypothetical protein GYA47_06175 [Desulfovibrio sp.]|nr:hypothetical protein [Desulfovibrio sp.]